MSNYIRDAIEYPNTCQNYRPISHLSFLSKTLERLVSLQFLPYLEQADLLPSAQSGFRGHHSTETALLSLLSDIYIWPLTKVISHFWPFLTSPQPLTWSTTRSCSNVCSYPVAYPISLFFGLNRTSQTALRWLSLVTPDPSGSGLDLAYLRDQCSDLSSISFTRLTSLCYSLNTLRLVTSMRMIPKHSCMAHQLINSLWSPLLMHSPMI